MVYSIFITVYGTTVDLYILYCAWTKFRDDKRVGRLGEEELMGEGR